MDITPMIPAGTNLITGYSNEGIKINNKTIQYDFILSANLLEQWDVSDETFANGNFDILLSHIERSEAKNGCIVLIGTGIEYLRPQQSLLGFFAKHHILPEIMSTLNACRTFNVLVAEQRPIFALIKNVVE